MKRDATALPVIGQAQGDTADPATAALGLPGFVVLAAGEYGGELELLVETTESVTGWLRCGVVVTLHDRKARLVRDLPAGGRRWCWCGSSGSGAARNRDAPIGPGRSARR